MSIQAALAAGKLQARLIGRDIEAIFPLFTMPPSTIAALAIFVNSGREDLAGYALCASFLLTIGQIALFNSSEIVSRDRSHQILELFVASPASYAAVLGTRTMVLTSLGLIGFLEGWLIARFMFGITIVVHHPGVLAAALIATAFASGATAMLTSAIFSVAKNTRTLQLTVNGPLYLLGGVLAPASLLPIWLQPLSPLIFLYWAANLVRDALAPAPVEHLAGRFAALCGLGLITGAAGAVVMERMLTRLRRTGELTLS